MSSPDPHDLPYDDQIADLESKLAFARDKMLELESELDWWLRGRDLYGKNNTNPTGARAGKPTLAEAIVSVMMLTVPGKIEWKAPEIMEQLRERNWMPTGKNAEHTVRTKLGQLARDGGELRRVRHGVYQLDRRGDAEDLLSTPAFEPREAPVGSR